MGVRPADPRTDIRLGRGFEKHYEHRYILGRLLYLPLHRLTGNWYPAGMVVNLLFLAGSAVVLIRTARKMRGSDHPADLWFAVLLLNAGHFENLLMSYQVVFTLTTILAVGLLAVMARSDRSDPARSGLWAGVLLLGVMSGGGIGLLFVPAVGMWIGYIPIRCIPGGRPLASGTSDPPGGGSVHRLVRP